VTLSPTNDEFIIDFITGAPIANAGAEANRQQVEHLLIETKGYAKKDVGVDVPISLDVDGERYESTADLVVTLKGHPYMVIKCAPGSLGSREREVIAAARLLGRYQTPLAVASDGRTTIVWDTVSGKEIGQGLDAVPSKPLAVKNFDPSTLILLPETKRRQQQLIFRSYDSMNVNVDRRQ
jgi:hypothetical protein